MKILHVDASAKRERSNSRALARYFLERLREERVEFDVDYLDVTVDTPPHVSEAFAIATYTAAQERTPAMKATLASSDALCARLLAADALVFAMPMYNWSMPSAFKAFIDSVTRTGVTYLGVRPRSGQIAIISFMVMKSEKPIRLRNKVLTPWTPACRRRRW
ncbi:FMN-dependent NADH-azoreductase, partial [Paraburkholderia sp. BR14320]|uniref:FMN-dependent NADH-azoreductase n=1 Tax=unclassified Paraburkholderia TaxID=2615204 RepID=UPI0034CE006E